MRCLVGIAAVWYGVGVFYIAVRTRGRIPDGEAGERTRRVEQGMSRIVAQRARMGKPTRRKALYGTSQ